MKNIIIGLLIGHLLALPLLATPYVAPKVFYPGDPIRSSDFNNINTAISAACGSGAITTAQLADSQVTSGKLAVGAAHGNLRANDVTFTMLDYSDSIYNDSMPLRSWATSYVGNNAASMIINCPINIVRYEIKKSTNFGDAIIEAEGDIRWNNSLDSTTPIVYYRFGTTEGMTAIGTVARVNFPTSSKQLIVGNTPVDLTSATWTYYVTVWGY